MGWNPNLVVFQPIDFQMAVLEVMLPGINIALIATRSTTGQTWDLLQPALLINHNRKSSLPDYLPLTTVCLTVVGAGEQ